jgi:hypothetical protein
LRHELACKRLLKDGLAQRGGAFQIGFNNRFDFINDRKPAFNFGDDALLFGERWQR